MFTNVVTLAGISLMLAGLTYAHNRLQNAATRRIAQQRAERKRARNAKAHKATAPQRPTTPPPPPPPPQPVFETEPSVLDTYLDSMRLRQQGVLMPVEYTYYGQEAAQMRLFD